MNDNNTPTTEDAQNDNQQKLQNQQILQALQMFGMNPQDVADLVKSQLEAEDDQEKQNRIEDLAEKHSIDMNQLARIEFVVEMLANELLQHKKNEVFKAADPNDIKMAIMGDILNHDGTGEAVAKSLTADIKTTVEMVAFLNEMFEAEELYQQYNINVPKAEKIYQKARKEQNDK